MSTSDISLPAGMVVKQQTPLKERVKTMVQQNKISLPVWALTVIILVIGFGGALYVQGARAEDRVGAIKNDLEWNKAQVLILNDDVIRLKTANEFTDKIMLLSKQITENDENQTKNMNRLIDAVNNQRR